MKKLFVFFLLASAAMGAFAQISIEHTDLIQPGDTFMISVDKNASVDIGAPGESFLTWDFTGLVEDSLKFACYGLNENLDFASAFPESNTYTYGPSVLYAGPFGASPANMFGYIMFNTDENGFRINGYRSDFGYGMTNVYNLEEEILMPVPFTYGDELETQGSWQVWHNFVSANADSLYRRSIYKNFEADAWGSMTTDYGTFDVIRVHEWGHYVDSIRGYISGFNVFSLEYQMVEFNNYYFWAKELRQPLAAVYLDGNGDIIEVDFLKAAMLWYSVQSSAASEQKLYPNPCSDFLYPGNRKGNYHIADITGKTIRCGAIDTAGQTIDVSSLQPGTYFLRFDGTTAVQRFVKQ